ncbi:MAG: UDP-N-acetylglucosamine 2-epimerase (hydrolyzing) [Desulfovibrionaceae bacterium]|nr:UDP-N-acetylglucosamine 2-epimerase (hydrolyzing) [Desulfovibrionaceae bacterium]
MRRICFFTATRAEYGILRPLMEAVRQDPDLGLQILVSGTHLCPDFGLTYLEIEAHGFEISERVDMDLGSDSAEALCRSAGLCLSGCGAALARLRPDIVVILGDRYEALAAALAAALCGLPLAHIHGGEASFGSADESFRHAITKLSHLHFTCAEAYRRRVVQLGEDPDRVFNVGALGVESIRRLKLLSRQELEADLGLDLAGRFALVTFHPPSLEPGRAEERFAELLEALDSVPDLGLVLTKANADPGGLAINRMIDEYAAANPGRAAAFASLGQLRYLSAMSRACVVVGNSSSGIVEAPSFRVPVVNVGDRQKGRLRAENVIDCGPSAAEIAAALDLALSEGFRRGLSGMSSPFEQQGTSARIRDALKAADLGSILKKGFHDLA